MCVLVGSSLFQNQTKNMQKTNLDQTFAILAGPSGRNIQLHEESDFQVQIEQFQRPEAKNQEKLSQKVNCFKSMCPSFAFCNFLICFAHGVICCFLAVRTFA